MNTHQSLSDVDIPERILRKLEDLAIRTVRQFYARLRDDGSNLQKYMGLSDEQFSRIYEKIENLIKDEYPQDMLPKIHPTVNKSGVAVHRLHDRTRPKYNKHG